MGTTVTNTDPKHLAKLNALLAQQKASRVEAKQKVTPFTGEESFDEGGYHPNPALMDFTGNLFGPNRMETPITEEEKSNPIVIQVVESDAYQSATTSGARQHMLDQALTYTNQAIYESKGEPAFFDTMRTQKFVDQEGTPKNFIIPEPNLDSSSAARVVGGGLLNLAKGVAGGVEKGFNIPFTDTKMFPGTDSLGITDKDTDFVAENFPTFPADGELEKAGQDVTSIIVGAVTGSGGVKALDDVVGISSKMSKWISKRWDETKKIDPVNAKKRLELLIKGLFIERGANLGATLATPEDMEPLVGDWAAEKLGFDPETNQQLGHYIDNEAFTALGTVAIKLMGMGWRFGKGLFPKFSKKPASRAAEVGMLLLKQIDPGITDDLPGELLAERARILGQVVLDNKEFQLGILGQKIVKDANGVETIVDLLPGGAIQLDSGTALALGARQYVDQAYGWMKATMSPEAYERTVNEYSQTIVDNIVGLKQGRKGNQVVQAGEASINADANRVLTSAADDAVEGGIDNANQAGVLLGDDVASPVVTALGNVSKTRTGVELAENVANTAQDKDVIIGLLDTARKNNSLGGTADEMQVLQRLTGDDLFTGWEASYKNYNDAFKNLPEDIPVDMQSLKELIEDVSAKTNDFDFVTSTVTKQDPFREMLIGLEKKVASTSDDGKAIYETDDEVIARLGTIDLKWLYTNLRPEISRRLNLLEASGAPKSDALIQLKSWIDDAAETSGEPEFRAAMDLYEEHAGVYLRTDELAQWEAKARLVRTKEVVPGVRMGQENAYELGMQALTIAEQSMTTGKLEAFLVALNKSSGKAVSQEMASAYVGLAIRALSRSTQAGTKVSAAQVRESVQPYLSQLEGTNPAAVKMFQDTVDTLEMVELGLTTAKQANAQAEQAYQTIVVAAQEKAASKFVNNLTGTNPNTMSDPSAVFKSIFGAKNAPDLMEQLLRQADDVGNPLIRDGLKSKYISYIKERIFTNKRIASEVTPEGVSATKELSPTQIGGILTGEFDNTLSTLKVVFKDEPKKAEALVHLLEVLDVAVNNRAIRGNNFGSSTVLDEHLKEKMNRLIVLTLGVLNPVATKARNISSALIDKRTKEVKEAIELQIDMMITSPAYFDEVMKAIATKAGGTPIMELIERNMVRGTMVLAKNRPIETLEAVPPEFEEQ